jgi:5,10-methylenetetrahydromethanopterin reductase
VTELFTMSIPEPSFVEVMAQRAEAGGWDGITFTDSQNLIGDPFIAMALGARCTERLQFMTGVTNAATRHPAALATAIATVQEVSEGRAICGIGRGDTALFHLGRPPQPVAEFVARTTALHTYLQGGVVDQRGFVSRLRWLDRAQAPPVPVDVAASGPKVITFAARTVERITFAVGADPDRLAWAIELARTAMKDAGRDTADVSLGAYVNLGCHPDQAAARALLRGAAAAFAHFSAMPGSTGAGLDERDRELVAEVGRNYDSNVHLVNSAQHSQVLPDDFLDRFAVVGDVNACTKRLQELVGLGLERLVLTPPSFGANREDTRIHTRLVEEELLPALR